MGRDDHDRTSGTAVSLENEANLRRSPARIGRTLLATVRDE